MYLSNGIVESWLTVEAVVVVIVVSGWIERGRVMRAVGRCEASPEKAKTPGLSAGSFSIGKFQIESDAG